MDCLTRFSIIALFFCFSCEEQATQKYEWKTIEVTATAYNSLVYQTDSDPYLTAFGDSLTPGLKCIAVSRDLLRLGLKHNTPVVIEGLDHLYLVKDKMHSRWQNKIDIYMGNNVKAAKLWGRKKVTLKYQVPLLE
ncbi:3D domain-containing protein [Hyunsoonleella aestuarii]|uniref:3D domain-containing protein n=1 Tax=Hyunsoonleella aestuarii TaxID=912802 RepID=A0ABP8EDV8_9FLAO|nr:3D domain-containing protein [Hyunsoonleella aestuarii]